MKCSECENQATRMVVDYRTVGFAKGRVVITEPAYPPRHGCDSHGPIDLTSPDDCRRIVLAAKDDLKEFKV